MQIYAVIIDLLALGVLGVYILMGARRGALSSLLRLAAPLLAYTVAFLGAPRVGPWLGSQFGLAGVLGVGLAGMILFMLSLVLFGVVTWVLRATLGRPFGRRRPNRLSRAGGGLIGAAHGALILLLLGLALSFLDAMRVSGAANLPELGGSRLVSMTQCVLERAVPAALGDSQPQARIASEFLAHPADTVERVQNVLADPRIEALARDRTFWHHVENGALDQALDRSSFSGIAYDETLRDELAELGLVGDAARTNAAQFRSSARQALQEIAPRLRQLRNDPALHELARDPEIQRALASGDTVTLLRNPEFRALLNRTLDGS